MTRELRLCLAEYPRIMLQAIAEGWRISLTDQQMPEIVERLFGEMTDPQALRAVVQRLSDAEQEALAFLANQVEVRAFVAVRKYGSIRRLGPGRLEWEGAWRSPASALEALWFLGLVHRAYGTDDAYYGEVYFVPQEIRERLPSMPVSLPVFQVACAEYPQVVWDDRDALARDVFVILSHLRNHDVFAKGGVLVRGELDKIRPRLSSDDPQRLTLLHHLCERAGWINRSQGLWAPTDRAAQWLREKPLARRKALYRVWLEDPDWNDLCRIPSLSCEGKGWRNDPALARKSFVAHLSKCPVGAWVTISSLTASIQEVDADFLRPDGDYESWHIRDKQTGQYLMGYRNWERVEGAWIRYLLSCPLRWWGVVAIGSAHEDGQADCFLVSSQGAAILGEDSAATAENKEGERPLSPARSIVVYDGLQVTVVPEAEWYDRYLLERFARWTDEQDGTARYVMDAESLQTALRRGVTVLQIRAFLRRASGGRLSPEVLQALTALAAQPRAVGSAAGRRPPDSGARRPTR